MGSIDKRETLADKLSSQFKGWNYLVVLNFLSDVLYHLSFWSLKMQERTAILVDFADFREQILVSFQNPKKKLMGGI